MTHERSHPDPHTLAAQLRLWVLEFVVWLAQWLGPLGAPLHAWAKAALDRAERGACGLAVLLAVRSLPAPLDTQRRGGGGRPLSAPRGFRRVGTRDGDIRGVTRGLFRRERNLSARAARLDAFLADIDAHAARLARRIARIPPASRLVAVAPPASLVTALIDAFAREAHDTS